jgi:hypothetical protein
VEYDPLHGTLSHCLRSGIHDLTVVEWLVFTDEHACKHHDSFNFVSINKYLRVNAYVIMPTHVHSILFDASSMQSGSNIRWMTCASIQDANC